MSSVSANVFLGASLACAAVFLGVASPAAAQTPLAASAPPPAPELGAPAPAPASAPAASTDEGAAAAFSSERDDKPRMFGAMFDLGVPDGTHLSFVFRPIDIARVHAGLGYNGVSPGLRIGGEYLPFGWGPSLGLAYGHYFEGDANGLASLFGEPSEDTSKVLEHVGYSYFALRLGMELGGDRFTFFGRGGISWLRTTIRELDSMLAPEEGSSTTISITEDPILRAWVPTLQFGLIVQI